MDFKQIRFNGIDIRTNSIGIVLDQKYYVKDLNIPNRGKTIKLE